jgi:uncharacterized protein (DUF3084 family)
MFAGGAYSRYSALENPYIVRETTDPARKPQVPAKNRSYLKKQELKQSQEEINLKRENAKAEKLAKELNSERTQNEKTDHYKSELKKQIHHISGAAAAAKKRVDHYEEKIKTLNRKQHNA